MTKTAKNILWGTLIVASWLVMYGAYYEAHKGEVAQKSRLAVLLTNRQSPPEIKEPVKFSDCHISGPLPDPECTPGEVFDQTSLETMCVSGYTKTVRKVSNSTKKKVYAMYGIDYPPLYGSYELDHLIPLALAGNNDVANLFPEAADPYPGFKEKDVVEIYLYQEACAGRIDVSVAQSQIAKDWVAIYNNLSPAVITAIKNRYKSWAN